MRLRLGFCGRTTVFCEAMFCVNSSLSARKHSAIMDPDLEHSNKNLTNGIPSQAAVPAATWSSYVLKVWRFGVHHLTHGKGGIVYIKMSARIVGSEATVHKGTYKVRCKFLYVSAILLRLA